MFPTPLYCALIALIFALKDSAEAFVLKLSKKFKMVLWWFIIVLDNVLNDLTPGCSTFSCHLASRVNAYILSLVWLKIHDNFWVNWYAISISGYRLNNIRALCSCSSVQLCSLFIWNSTVLWCIKPLQSSFKVATRNQIKLRCKYASQNLYLCDHKYCLKYYL